MKKTSLIVPCLILILSPVVALAQKPDLYFEDDWKEENISETYDSAREVDYIVPRKINAFTSAIDSLSSPTMAFTVIFVFVIMLAVMIYLGAGFMAVYWVVMNE